MEICTLYIWYHSDWYMCIVASTIEITTTIEIIITIVVENEFQTYQHVATTI